MPDKTIDFDEKTEVGGFNPERRKEKKKEQVGPAPTDDPRGIGAFSTPSNRLFVPAEYWSVNCCICLCENPEFECYIP